MADWIYQALESFQTFMDTGSLADVILLLVISAIGGILLIAVHEAGHALAAVLTGNRVRELRVGHSDDLTLTAGSFRLRLGRLRDDSDTGGYVICDMTTATPWQAFVIALAGPAANLVGAMLTALLAVRADGMLSVGLFLWTFASLATAVANLRAKGDPDTPAEWNDGRLAQVAWAARRARPAGSPPHRDPNTATSVPPPRR